MGELTGWCRDSLHVVGVHDEGRGQDRNEIGREDRGESTVRKPEPLSDLRTGGPALLYGHWICDHCKNVVQAETLARKRKIEKEMWSGVTGRRLSDSFSGSAVI